MKQIVRHVFDGGEVGWHVVGPDPALVVSKGHVHDPMQAVLDRPMASYDGPAILKAQVALFMKTSYPGCR